MMIKEYFLRHHRLSSVAIAVCFVCMLSIGLYAAKDYGVSWDEKAMLILGEEAFNAVWKGLPYPTDFGIRFHGSYIEIFLYAIEKIFHIDYARHLLIIRHACAYGIFWIGLILLYILARRIFQHRGYAVLVSLLLFLSPTQFGHAFVNTRDIPTMVLYIAHMLTLSMFLHKLSARNAVLHGITCGMILALRIGAAFAPLFTAVFLLLYSATHWKEFNMLPLRKLVIASSTFAVSASLSTFLLWPLLWSHPITNLLAALRNMMHQQQAPGGLLLGEIVGQLPLWVPVHFLVKTPPIIVALFFVGTLAILAQFLRRPWDSLSREGDLLMLLLWWSVPLATVIILKATLFDEWRHLYFVYPAVLLTAVHGLRSVLARIRHIAQATLRRLLCASVWCVLAISMGSTAVWMIRNHPLQYVYFSIPSSWVEYNFELDYWGLSYRQGFEWVLKHDSGSLIPITVTSSPGWENLNILRSNERKRIVMNKKYRSKYILDNYDWKHYRHILPDSTMVHAIRVSGMPVLGIYQNPAWSPEESIDPRDQMEDYKLHLWVSEESAI